MHLILGKKQVLLAGLVAILGLAVFVNWYFLGDSRRPDIAGSNGVTEAEQKNDGSAQLVGALTEDEYFASVRLSRDTARQESLETLNAVLVNAGEGAENTADTAAAIEAISKAAVMENDIESLVSGKTGGGCVAVISDNAVDVVVSSGALNESNVLTISDIVSEVCGDQYENVRISGTAG